MQTSPSQVPVGSRVLKCIAGRTRLQIGIALLVVWSVGLYMGSSGNVSFQVGTVQQSLQDTANVVRNVSTIQQSLQDTANVVRHAGNPQNPSELSNFTAREDQNATSKQSNVKPTTAELTTTISLSSTFPHTTALHITSKTPQNRSSICEFPTIDPFDPSIEKYLKRNTIINCTSNMPNVVYLKNEEITINQTKAGEAMGRINSTGKLGFCQYRNLQRRVKSDNSVNIAFTSAKFNKSIKVRKSDEDIKVECFDTNGTTISRSYFTIMRLDPEKELIHNDSYKVHMDKNAPVETLSILMIGIDGFAKQHFARAMPKTRDFLIKELGALEMNKHSKLGYSTSPNVIPLLTGRTNEELAKNSLWNYQSRGWMDQINEALVWSDARRVGYRTGLMFDQVYITAFHYLRNGFNRKPVDHYMRPLVVESIKDPLMRKPNRHCFGDELEITKLYDYWLQLVHHYNSTKTNQTPFFAYSFLTRLTHDNYNLAFAGDELYLKFLKDLKATNALNNTVIIWFSDHGERFGAIRHTFTGEVETNTPYLFFAFPPWFEKKYPEVMREFRTNQNRLTSHFDTYATMQDLLNFKGVVGPKGKFGERSISFFREIPLHRTCEDAQIPAEYCLCSGLSKANLAPGLDKYFGTLIKDKVNSLVKTHKDKCAQLKLKSVESVLEEKNEGKESKSKTRNFRVSIKTEPGEALFEARVSFDANTNKAKVEGEVARTNMYRGQAECMETAALRRYCFCKNSVAKPA